MVHAVTVTQTMTPWANTLFERQWWVP